MLWLIRHAAALDRYVFEGDDKERPLSERGHAQARELVTIDMLQPATALVSSPAVRCLQTLAPLQAKLGLEIEIHDALAEGASAADGLALLRSRVGSDAIFCSHGDIIPSLVQELLRDGMTVVGSRGCEKASIWALEVVGVDIARGKYHPPIS